MLHREEKLLTGGKMKIVRLILLLAFLTACGSGGGVTGTAVDPGSDPEPVATKATVTVRTQAASAETVLFAVDLVLNLPTGVTVAVLPDKSVASAALETTVGVAGGRYVPATATTPARVTVQVANAEGFTVGSLVTLNCDISPGAAVTPEAFTIASFMPLSKDGVEMTGITPRLSVQLK